MSTTSPETDPSRDAENPAFDDLTSAISGVVVSSDSVKTKKNSSKNKILIGCFIVVIGAIAIGLGYFFGTRTSSSSSIEDVTHTEGEIVDEDDSVDENNAEKKEEEKSLGPQDVPSTKTLLWNQVGDALVGTQSRQFFGAGVSTNRDGSAIAIISKAHKNFYKEIDGNWMALEQVCGFCKDTYGDAFDPDFVDPDSESGWGVTMSADGNIASFGASFSNFGIGYVRKLNETSGIYESFGQPFYGDEIIDEFGCSPVMSEDGSTFAAAALAGDYVRFYEQSKSDNSDHWQVSGSIEIMNLGFFRSQFLGLSGDGSRAAVSVPFEGVKIIDRKESGNWEITASINFINATEVFGLSVALSFSGERVLISDPRMKNEEDIATGGILVYSQDTTTREWSQLGNTMYGENPADYFGFSCSISSDGTRVAGGAHGDQGNFMVGYVKVFDFEEGSWNQVGQQIIGSEPHVADWFGYDFALSYDGNRLISGAMLYSGNETNSFKGQVTIFELVEKEVDSV